jgi:hypothetical protein
MNIPNAKAKVSKTSKSIDNAHFFPPSKKLAHTVCSILRQYLYRFVKRNLNVCLDDPTAAA